MLFGLEHCQGQLNVLNLGCLSSTNVTTIAKMVIEAMNLTNVELAYTGGDRGWRGDIPRVRLDMTKMNRLGWKPKYSSTEAIRRAIRDMLSNKI
ncbi:hypothetical protein ACFLX4_01800 [Chloroflexota bacterium]